jgi:hypothetical protein
MIKKADQTEKKAPIQLSTVELKAVSGGARPGAASPGGGGRRPGNTGAPRPGRRR